MSEHCRLTRFLMGHHCVMPDAAMVGTDAFHFNASTQGMSRVHNNLYAIQLMRAFDMDGIVSDFPDGFSRPPSSLFYRCCVCDFSLRLGHCKRRILYVPSEPP